MGASQNQDVHLVEGWRVPLPGSVKAKAGPTPRRRNPVHLLVSTRRSSQQLCRTQRSYTMPIKVGRLFGQLEYSASQPTGQLNDLRPLSQPLRPGLQRYHFPARKENTVIPTSQSNSSGRSGQQVSCGAWSAKHSRSGTEVRLSGRAKYVTPADTRWRPCFARQRQRLHERGGWHGQVAEQEMGNSG